MELSQRYAISSVKSSNLAHSVFYPIYFDFARAQCEPNGSKQDRKFAVCKKYDSCGKSRTAWTIHSLLWVSITELSCCCMDVGYSHTSWWKHDKYWCFLHLFGTTRPVSTLWDSSGNRDRVCDLDVTSTRLYNPKKPLAEQLQFALYNGHNNKVLMTADHSSLTSIFEMNVSHMVWIKVTLTSAAYRT